jgi:hypothetical protein
MKITDIKAIQAEIGTVPDGIWGPKSKAACKTFLKSLCPNNPWPRQADRVAFFGKPGTRQTRIDVTGLGVKYDGETVNSILCHKNVAPTLLAIIKKISASPWAYVLAEYAGCYADKPLMHGHAAAIDLMPNGNGMDKVEYAWPSKATMPWGVIKIFAAQGWTSAGASWGYDAMHFQATTWD